MDASTPISKYPRTPHLEGSRKGLGDDLDDVSFGALAGVHLVVEEKVDGANCAISFGADRQLRLQSRGHWLTGGPRERHFAGLKAFASAHTADLWDVLGDRYLCYGEWCYARHTVFYDALAHHFLEFDIFDMRTGTFLDTEARHDLLAGSPVVSVPVLARGAFTDPGSMVELVGPSRFITAEATSVLTDAARMVGADVELTLAQHDQSGLAEGLYVKREADGVVTGRFKWVRSEFLQTLLDSDSHWQSRPIIANRLADGVDVFEPCADRPPLPEIRP